VDIVILKTLKIRRTEFLVGEWEIAQVASSEARKVEVGATGFARSVSTLEKGY